MAAEEVKVALNKFILEHNRCNGEPIFSSFIVTHTGDDVAVTGIMRDGSRVPVLRDGSWQV